MKYKVDLLLRSATAIAKRDTQCENTRVTEMVQVTEKRNMSMPFKSDGAELMLEGQVNNVVFAGDEGDLDATLIVFRAAKAGRAQVWTLLKLMGKNSISQPYLRYRSSRPSSNNPSCSEARRKGP